MTLMQIGIRLAVVVVGLAGWFWTQSLIGKRSTKGGLIGDRLHDMTEDWNSFLHRNPKVADGSLIVSSIFIDLFAVFLIGAGIFGSTLRPFIALIMLFIFRQLCQALCALPIPPGMIWRHPGFPSLLVTYGVSNDFFISGHTAIAVLGAVEISRMFSPEIGALAILVAVLEGIMVIVLRAHYTMDVLAAVAAALCAAGIAGQICQSFGI